MISARVPDVKQRKVREEAFASKVKLLFWPKLGKKFKKEDIASAIGIMIHVARGSWVVPAHKSKSVTTFYSVRQKQQVFVVGQSSPPIQKQKLMFVDILMNF